jgi:hypothetical protein
MAATREELQHHLTALEEFEPKYRAYVKQRKSGLIHINEVGSRTEVTEGEWPSEKLEGRKNELLELGPSVDEALMTAGVGVPAMTHPPALGGGLKARGVTSLMFNHEEVGGDASGYAMSKMILERTVAGKGALRAKLRRASPIGRAISNRAQEPKAPGQSKRWRGLFGRLRFVPPVIGFIADFGSFVLLVALVGRLFGVW